MKITENGQAPFDAGLDVDSERVSTEAVAALVEGGASDRFLKRVFRFPNLRQQHLRLSEDRTLYCELPSHSDPIRWLFRSPID
jgi:hypothetical protein